MKIYKLTAFENKKSVYIEVGQYLQNAGPRAMNEQSRCCWCLLAGGAETGMKQETSFPLCSRYRLDPLLIACGGGARACRCLRVSRNGTGEDRLRLGSSAGPSFGFWDCDHDYRLPTFLWPASWRRLPHHDPHPAKLCTSCPQLWPTS